MSELEYQQDDQSHFAEIYPTRAESKEIAAREEHEEYWACGDCSDLYSYADTFRKVSGRNWPAFLTEQKERQGENSVLDLMGSGSIFVDLPADNKLAVALHKRHYFLIDDQRVPLPKGLDVIEGDVLSRSTWQRIMEWKEGHTSGNGFDLILCRPNGGLAYTTSNPDVLYFLIEQIYELLNRENGTLYTQLPRSKTNERISPEIREWLKLLETTEGIKIRFDDNSFHFHDQEKWGYDYAVLRLQRSSESPDQLPKLEPDDLGIQSQ